MLDPSLIGFGYDDLVDQSHSTDMSQFNTNTMDQLNPSSSRGDDNSSQEAFNQFFDFEKYLRELTPISSHNDQAGSSSVGVESEGVPNQFPISPASQPALPGLESWSLPKENMGSLEPTLQSTTAPQSFHLPAPTSSTTPAFTRPPLGGLRQDAPSAGAIGGTPGYYPPTEAVNSNDRVGSVPEMIPRDVVVQSPALGGIPSAVELLQLQFNAILQQFNQMDANPTKKFYIYTLRKQPHPWLVSLLIIF